MSRKGKGFTLPEVLVTGAILILVVAGTLSVYLMCYTCWREVNVAASLQREASIAMEKLIRGVKVPAEDKKHGIREATSFILPNTSSIKFTSGLDNRTRSFYLSGNEIIYYYPYILLGDNKVIVAEGIKSLSFDTISDRKVKISITLEKYILNKPINVSLETIVTIRN